jgi:cytochrome P450 family 135
MQLPPGSQLPPSHQTALWLNRPLEFLSELAAAHGDVFTIRVLNEEPFVMVSDPWLLEQVFTASADVLHAGEGNRILAPLFGPHSVLLLDEAEHMRQRRLLLPPFRSARLEVYEDAMRDAAAAVLDRWPAEIPVPAWPRMHAITLEVILRAVFGATERARLEPLRAVLEGLLEYVSGGSRAVFVALANSDRRLEGRFAAFHAALARAKELVLAELARSRAEEDLDDREDVCSLLLRTRHMDGSPMSDAEVADELMTLLIAGHETTSTALAWALEQLSRHPDALERVAAEAEHGGGPYTDAAIKETLRIRPVFPCVARRVKQPFELGGWTLPPQTTITPNILLLHRRSDVYPDPEAFLPERFLDRTPGTYTWIPFGGGVRRCIGAGFALLEMRVVLATLLERAELRPADPDPEPPGRRLLTLPPAHGARVILKRRNGIGQRKANPG